jgi:hypothetical protein
MPIAAGVGGIFKILLSIDVSGNSTCNAELNPKKIRG